MAGMVAVAAAHEIDGVRVVSVGDPFYVFSTLRRPDMFLFKPPYHMVPFH